MNKTTVFSLALCLLVSAGASAQVKVLVDRNEQDGGFKFERLPSPVTNDAAAGATLTLISGERDGNGGEVAVLTDGKLPSEADEPKRNFFLRGEADGRIVMDLGREVPISRVDSYSWHVAERGPQVYALYGATGAEAGFVAEPGEDVDPASAGWTHLADIDTTPEEGGPGGQHAAAVGSDAGLGKFRYLLFDIKRAGGAQTFFSEIDVIDAEGPELVVAEVPKKLVKEYKSPDRRMDVSVDYTLAPDMLDWTEKNMLPMVYDWYPKLVKMLPSPGYTAPTEVRLEYRDDMGGTPAYAAGTRVALNIDFFRGQMQGEGKGAVVHEMAHVVQNYPWGHRRNPDPLPAPFWLQEGIPDYIRWFLYEPEKKGAEITKGNFEKANYDSAYRISANFLNWAVKKYDRNGKLIEELNAVCREARYTPGFWKEWTGRTIEELNHDWKAENAKNLGIDWQG